MFLNKHLQVPVHVTSQRHPLLPAPFQLAKHVAYTLCKAHELLMYSKCSVPEDALSEQKDEMHMWFRAEFVHISMGMSCICDYTHHLRAQTLFCISKR